MRARGAAVVLLLVLGSTATASVVGAGAVSATSPVANGTRFHEGGNAAEYISWFGASLPLSAADARAFAAEGNKAVTTVSAGYVNAHPASDFPAHRAFRIVGSLSDYLFDGQEILPLRPEDATTCLSNVGQATLAVVPDLWARSLTIGPDTACPAQNQTFGPFSLVQSYRPPTSAFGFSFPGNGLSGDFNGDGKADVFVYGDTSDPDAIWYGTGSGFELGPTVTVNGSYEPFVGDFNGDGRDDIFWYAAQQECIGEGCPSYASSIWLGRPGDTGFLHGPAIPKPPVSGPIEIKAGNEVITIGGSLYEPLVGDFNGDGKDDVYWFATARVSATPEPNVLWYGRALGFAVGSSSTTPIPGENLDEILPSQLGGSLHFIEYTPPQVADYNGDGKDDLLWYQPGATRLWRGTTGAFTNVTIPTVYSSYTPAVGDFTGDGKADVLWYGRGASHDSYWLGSAGGFAAGPSITVNGVYQPYVGDFNGDGRQDVLWRGVRHLVSASIPVKVVEDPSSVWFGRTSGFAHSGAFTQSTPATDLFLSAPAIGDFNGDGHDDLLWWRLAFNTSGFSDSETADLWRAS